MEFPDLNQLYAEYFAPWYSPMDRVRKKHGAIRPDMEELGAAASLDGSAPSPLAEKLRSQVAERITAMTDAAGQDWHKLLEISGRPSMAWLTSFDAYFGPKQVEKVVMNSSTETFNNDYLVLCCELGSVIGTVMRDLEPRLTWLYDSPLLGERFVRCTDGLSPERVSLGDQARMRAWRSGRRRRG